MVGVDENDLKIDSDQKVNPFGNLTQGLKSND